MMSAAIRAATLCSSFSLKLAQQKDDAVIIDVLIHIGTSFSEFCVAACIRHYFPRQGRRLEPRWRASREFHPSEDLSELRTGVSL